MRARRGIVAIFQEPGSVPGQQFNGVDLLGIKGQSFAGRFPVDAETEILQEAVCCSGDSADDWAGMTVWHTPEFP
ncbi:hypothetical protein GCM10025778_35570 [Paeniglutamicibacter antarcticus]|uniref:Uncharacterized protein n=1 Tax=Paeniglutamicibacter antarcticus TaxID=494023 RepID=A0ABP9TTD8_9MICC